MIYLDLTDQFAGALGFASALSLPYLLDEVRGSSPPRSTATRRRRSGSRSERLYRSETDAQVARGKLLGMDITWKLGFKFNVGTWRV